ncbi:S-methyl-5'-thioadenosine phosphorylase [Methanobacterium sp. CWC-01]|uniref:S-methyl-5'-thioadenosine phosphorylase n=1 Tax=Methanobacterium aridiramus TaxID=2584467 RepID=UPI0025759048|nr:S-methyl-5'-thioadenosine phosphorylase [Methanobacterium sp. CWC-01]WJI09966.1 S-methyl-5'-thioadenosine phosphorylase [Methanobacterium sp. CWC-01]
MLAVIGGTGVYRLVEKGEELESMVINTPYGDSPQITRFQMEGMELFFMPRHHEGHDNPPHRINYRANLCALQKLGVKRVLATNAVGSLDEKLEPGTFLAPDDFLDFTHHRPVTFYDQRTVHVDVTQPYCPHLRKVLLDSGEVVDGGVYVCVEGPRFETPAEIRMFRQLGGTVVGMTGLPEVVLARELSMCYASVCMISNYAASISPDKVTIDEVFQIMDGKKKQLTNLLRESILNIPPGRDCHCEHALQGAEIE